MSNLRIVYNNIADRATLSASTTSGALGVSNLKTEIKGQVHRSTGTSVTITATWDSNQAVGCVAIPAINLSSSATVQVLLYSDTAATVQIFSSGTLSPIPVRTYSNWPQGIDVNSFYYDGVVKLVTWITSKPTNVRACKIILTDASNTKGYIDSARLVIGDYWSPTYNFQSGVTYEAVDNSTVSRTEAGDMLANRRYQYDKLTFNFAILPETDKASLSRILKDVGTSKNFLLSLVPEYTDKETVQDYTIYGKREASSYTQNYHKYFDQQLTINGW